MRGYFDGFGTILNIELPRDHITQAPKGYVIIEFEKASQADEAIEMLDGMDING